MVKLYIFVVSLVLFVSHASNNQFSRNHRVTFPVIGLNAEDGRLTANKRPPALHSDEEEKTLRPKKSKRSMERSYISEKHPMIHSNEVIGNKPAEYDSFLERSKQGLKAIREDVPELGYFYSTSTETVYEPTDSYINLDGLLSSVEKETDFIHPKDNKETNSNERGTQKINEMAGNRRNHGIHPGSSRSNSNKLYGQNLVIFGHIDRGSFIRSIKKCSTYTEVDLLSKYAISELTSKTGNPMGQLLLYFNMIEVTQENYSIALESIKRILDHFTVTYQGLAMFSVLHSREMEEDELKDSYLDTEFHWKLNDAVMSYCSIDYPRCHVIPDLSTITKALNDSYQKDLTLDEYESQRFSRVQCTDGECQKQSITLDERFTLSELSHEKQLHKFKEIFCKVSYHRVIEFRSYLLGEDPDSSTPVPTPSSTSRMGLVLNDILPLDLKQYDKNQPPRFEGQPTIVYFHVTVLSVDSINEESMTYVTDIFLAQSWRDHRLRLPENMTEEYRILDVEWLQRMWRPDCFFKNAKRVTFHEMSVPNHYLWLYHDKTLLYMAKLTLVLSCAMKFEGYPHDTQICSMMIESLSHTTHDLVFKWNETDPLVVNPDIELPQLDISRNYTEDCTLNYSTGNFTCLAIVFNLRRRLGYHLFHTYIPSALTVVMSWISFWIKPEAIPARVTLGVTSLLTLATQNQQSQQSLPPVSYIKAVDVWMSSCTVFVFASLIQFGIVNHFMNDAPVTKDMTGYSIEDLTSSFDDRKSSEDAELTHRSNSRSRSRTRGRSPGGPQYVVSRCSGKDIAYSIDRFSRYFFPFSFMLINISYWSVYGF